MFDKRVGMTSTNIVTFKFYFLKPLSFIYVSVCI